MHPYRPQTTLQEGNVFTPICHSVQRGRGGVLTSLDRDPPETPLGQKDPSPRTVKSRQYASYWNAYLFLWTTDTLFGSSIALGFKVRVPWLSRLCAFPRVQWIPQIHLWCDTCWPLWHTLKARLHWANARRSLLICRHMNVTLNFKQAIWKQLRFHVRFVICKDPFTPSESKNENFLWYLKFSLIAFAGLLIIFAFAFTFPT